MNKTITFECSALVQKLALANKVINAKNVIPALNNFRIETLKDNTLRVTASDSELWLQTDVTGVECEEGMLFAIDAKQFMSALSPLGERQMAMEVNMESHTCTLRYANGHITIPILDANDYPMPKVETEEGLNKAMNCAQLQNAIGHTVFCVASDEIRQVMNGVCFDFKKDGLVCAATNGRKLIRYTDKKVTCESEEQEGKFIMPTKVCNVLLSIMSQLEDSIVSMRFTAKNVQVAGVNFHLTARLIEGNFPNYNAVIPNATSLKLDFDKKLFVETLRHVMPLGNQENQLVALKFEQGQVTVYAEDFSYNCGAYETLSCAYANNNTFLIGFNGAMLMQLVQNTQGDRFVLAMIDERKPVLILETQENEEYECVSLIMPMVVNA